MKKIAIIGASYLQLPLIKKAKELQIETHVFAWEKGAVGKSIADYFYPISILDKERILDLCKSIKIDGITTIATDIAMPTVNYVANELKLMGNSLNSTLISTDKFEMRKALLNNNIPCPNFAFFTAPNFNNHENFSFPLIVKPTDRSGSRGVTKVYNIDDTNSAISKALIESLSSRVIVEEFIDSEKEYSVEFISFNGVHYPLAVTEKVTTREPYFVEIAHHQPAKLSDEIYHQIYKTTKAVLTALGIANGASHTELYLMGNNEIRIVESAGRMGGELIGSHMVPMSTGFDFLHATLDVALNQFNYNKYIKNTVKSFSGVYYILPKPGKIISITDNSNNFEDIVHCEAIKETGDLIEKIIDGSDKRAGIIVYHSDKAKPISNPNEVLKFITE